MEHLKDIVDNKRVCVAGSSKCIERNPAGFIDSFDVVFRVNQSWCNPEEFRENIGHRIDILYVAGKEGYVTIDIFRQLSIQESKGKFNYSEIKYIKHESNQQHILELINSHNILSTNDFEYDTWKFQHEAKLKKRPSGGLFAIWELLHTNITQLYITGISFYTEPYKKGHIPTDMMDKNKNAKRTNKHHDSLADEEYFCNTLYPQYSDLILLDPTLQEIYRGHC